MKSIDRIVSVGFRLMAITDGDELICLSNQGNKDYPVTWKACFKGKKGYERLKADRPSKPIETGHKPTDKSVLW